MGHKAKAEEPVVFRTKLLIPYKNYAGGVGSRFLREIRDNRRIMGVRCPECCRVYVPPRATCFKCFSELKEWVPVGDAGTLMSYTTVHYREAMHPLEPPFAYGIIKLDGADTGLVHLLGEVDPNEVAIGMRFQAVYKENREGSVLDIAYFRPL